MSTISTSFGEVKGKRQQFSFGKKWAIALFLAEDNCLINCVLDSFYLTLKIIDFLYNQNLASEKTTH